MTGQLLIRLARKYSQTLTPTLKYRQMSYRYEFLYLLPRFKTETKAWQSAPRDSGLCGALPEPKQAGLSLSHFSDGLREKEASVLNHRLTRRKWALFSPYCRKNPQLCFPETGKVRLLASLSLSLNLYAGHLDACEKL